MSTTYTYDPIHPPILAAGDTLLIPYQAEPWPLKIPICYDGITIRGLLGPNGERPILTGAGAREMPYFGFFSDQIAWFGLILAAPAAGYPYDGLPLQNIMIENLILQDCNAGADGYWPADGGQQVGWDTPSAGVTAYRAGVTVRNCEIHRCGNGVFGKCMGPSASQLLGPITLEGVHVHDCGAAATDHQHSIYVESPLLTLRNCRVFGPQTGGVALKSRSAICEVYDSELRSGSYVLDLVEPDDGGQFLKDQAQGQPHKLSNCFIINDQARTAVFFGFDQVPELAPERCIVEFCRVKNLNNRNGGLYYTILYKATNGSEIDVFASEHGYEAPDGSGDPGDLYLVTGGGGGDPGGTLNLSTDQPSTFPAATIPDDGTGCTVLGWEAQTLY